MYDLRGLSFLNPICCKNNHHDNITIPITMDILLSLKSLLIDHLRLTLMTQIQRENKSPESSSLYPAIALVIFLSAMAFLFDNVDVSAVLRNSNGWDVFMEIWELGRQPFRRRHSVTLEGKHATSVDGFGSRNMITVTNSFTVRFRAVIHHVCSNMEQFTDIYDVKEMANIFSRFEETKTILTVSQNRRFLLDKEKQIYCKIKEGLDRQNSDGKDSASNYLRVYCFEIQIFSFVTTPAVINQYIDSLADKYNEHLETLRKGKLFVYTLRNASSCNDDDNEMDVSQTWKETPHETMKSFSNLFFEGKQEVLKKIDFFVNNKEWYRTNGVPYTLGIALYGEPGTGKTSFIKALATRLGRHIVTISLASIKHRRQLHDIFHTTKYTENDKKAIGFDQKIIVFEDIDCVGKMVAARKEGGDEDDDKDNSDEESRLLGKLAAENAKQKKAIMKSAAAMVSAITDTVQLPDAHSNKNDITLDDLLNLWDGIRENTGRIMIVTTNHFDKLDPALVRPGRIDMPLHLGNASQQTIGEMFQHYYQRPLTEEEWCKVPDKVHSPAQVINYYISHNDNPEGFLAALSHNNS